MHAVPGSFIGRALAVAGVTAIAAAPLRLTARQGVDIPVVRLEGVTDRQSNQPRPLPVTRLDDRQRTADFDGTPTISMTFASPLAVRDVLLLLFRGTPFSVVLDSGVNGSFVGELSGLSLRQGLEAVLFPAGLDYQLKGSVVGVFPRRPATRLYAVSHVDVTRTWQRRVRSVTSADAGYPAAEMSAAVESNFFQRLADGVRTLLSSSGRVHVDRTAGIVQVTDFADRLDQVGVYIETVTLRASRQVRLDAKVLEVTLDHSNSIDWGVLGQRAGLTIGTGAGVKVADFNALLQAIATFGSVHTIASPQFVAMNNEPAYMRIGSEAALFDQPGAGESGKQPVVTDGFTLSITSQIGADGIVHMSISPTWTERRQDHGGRNDRERPASVVELDTTMRVREGETVVISGLLRETAERVSADGLSGIFGATRQKAGRTELIILLTPTIVTASSPAAGAQ